MLGKESAGFGSEHVLIGDVFSRYPEARSAERSVVGTKRVFPLVHGGKDLDEVMTESGDLDQYRLFLLLALELAKRGGTLGFVVGGGLAKNPADASLRRILFRNSCVTVFAHYLNLRQLFEGASSRVSFVVVVSVHSEVPAKSHIAFDLTEFSDLTRDTAGSWSLRAFSPADVREHLARHDDLTEFVDERKSHLQTTESTVSAFRRMSMRMSNDLHRTNCKPALTALGSILPHATDARSPEILAELLDRGHVCFYDGRSIDFFNSFPTKKSGKWLPQVILVANVRHSMVARLSGRLRYYRLAWRSTCGHPKTNPRACPCMHSSTRVHRRQFDNS